MSEILDKAIGTVSNANKAFCRFITVNDTGKNGSHQSGFYIPKCAWSLLFNTPGVKGEIKDRVVEICWQDAFKTESRFIYYGKGTRNEYRLTRFGKNFPFFEEENVGDLLIIVQIEDSFYKGFVLQSDDDIDSFLDYFNLTSATTNQMIDVNGALSGESQLDLLLRLLVESSHSFPDTVLMAQQARDSFNKAFSVKDIDILSNPDKFILNWIDTEYRLFRNLEEKIYRPVFTHPFENCQALVSFSNTILNRRKSRAGKSLEHHLANIFTISSLRFEEQVITEDNKKPDFIFPDGASYHNFEFPADQLIFLGAKTTCKDRWRQVLNEANRIDTKYLFTLQQGISKNQLKEMKHEHLKLVVPAVYKKCFDSEFHSEIETLSSFINIVRHKQGLL